MTDIKFQDSDDEWSDLGLSWPLSRNEKLIARILILVIILLGLAVVLIGR
jgi:hypothetical protein